MHIPHSISDIQYSIIGQLRKPNRGQSKRVDGFVYSFITTLSIRNVDWDKAEDMLLMALYDLNAFHLPQNDTKDIEIALDIASGLYTIRFATTTNLPDMLYAVEVIEHEGEWGAALLSGEQLDKLLEEAGEEVTE